MEKTTKTVAYSVSLVYNPSLPKNLRTEEKKIKVYDKTDHKMVDKILPAQKVEDCPNTVPGIQYILATNKIDLSKSTPEFATILYEEEYDVTIEDKNTSKTKALKATRVAYKEARSKIMNKIEELKKLLAGLGVVVMIHAISADKKPKRKKKPSNNKGVKNTSKKAVRFEKKTLEHRMPRKKKKAAQKEAVEYTLTMLNDLNNSSLTKSQIKRARHRIELIEFVNVMCDQKFDTYKDAMKFIRSRNKSELKLKMAA